VNANCGPYFSVLQSVDKEPMTVVTNKVCCKKLSALRQSIIVLSGILISFGGILLACTYVFPPAEESTIPITGSSFYLISAFLLIAYFVWQWKKGKSIEAELANELKNGNSVIFTERSLSGNVLKWMVTIFAAFFTLLCAAITMICIYGPNRMSAQPKLSSLFFLSGLLVIGFLIFAAWKIWATPTNVYVNR
jgi:hypothetical protein